MSEDTVVDLKQFITGLITRQTSDIRQDITRLDMRVDGLAQDVTGLRQNVVDLTQNVTGLTQTVTNLAHGLERLDKRVSSLEIKVDEGFSGIAEILEDTNTRCYATYSLVKDHTQRIARLDREFCSKTKEDYLCGRILAPANPSA